MNIAYKYRQNFIPTIKTNSAQKKMEIYKKRC